MRFRPPKALSPVQKRPLCPPAPPSANAKFVSFFRFHIFPFLIVRKFLLSLSLLQRFFSRARERDETAQRDRGRAVAHIPFYGSLFGRRRCRETGDPPPPNAQKSPHGTSVGRPSSSFVSMRSAGFVILDARHAPFRRAQRRGPMDENRGETRLFGRTRPRGAWGGIRGAFRCLLSR
jgi:hypothetical protein